MSARLPLYVSLPMYDWPECRDATEADWARIRQAAPEVLPAALGRIDWSCADAYFRDPALVFSQCCWGPLSRGLLEWLEPLAQPDYSAFEGGRGPFYRSALVARSGAAVAVPDGPGPALVPLAGLRLAINERDSLSGCLGLWDDLGADPCTVAAGCVETGSHRASVRAVAEGRADLAAIDCRSWALALAHEPFAQSLVVVGWTSERPGLPYVTSRATDPALKSALRAHLLRTGCHPVAEGRNG